MTQKIVNGGRVILLMFNTKKVLTLCVVIIYLICLIATIFYPENKLIKFRLHKFGEFGLFTKLSNQIPYHSWQIKPLGKSHVEFTLRTPMVKLFLEIKVSQILKSLIND